MNSIAGPSKTTPAKIPDKRMPPIRHFCLMGENEGMNPGQERQTLANKLAVNTNKNWPRHRYSNDLQAHSNIQYRVQLVSIKYAKKLALD